ncbi:response regulator [Proteobacteria bacterium 005FR1]|nr:response regulator [Proteobacteria bacterium 005FR1]
MKKALIAEDEIDLLQALKTVLEGEGFSVTACKDGREAINMMQDSPPSLLITDLMMPRMSGLELIHEMRSRNELKEVPVIMISCADLPDGMRDEDIQSFLRKPFSVRKLLREVNRVLEGR